MLTPAQLGRAVADRTGFEWTWGGFDMLGNDEHGYRVLVGGVDGDHVFANQRDPGMTWSLVVERLAQAAASAVSDSLGADDGDLFGGVTAEDLPGDSAFDAALERLYWQLMGRRADGAALAEAAALWSAIEALDSAEAAWAGVLEAWLRDPEFVTL
jgi:hypothetical protein